MKASTATFLRFLCSLTSARAVQPAKHLSGTSVTDSGYSNSVRAVQPSNADTPNEVRFLVFFTSTRAVQSLNAASLTVVILLLNLMLVILELPSKQPAPTVITSKLLIFAGILTSVSLPTYLIISTAEPASTLMYS